MVEDKWRIQSDRRRENSQELMTTVFGSLINSNKTSYQCIFLQILQLLWSERKHFYLYFLI